MHVDLMNTDEEEHTCIHALHLAAGDLCSRGMLKGRTCSLSRCDLTPATVIIAVIDALRPPTRISIFATRVEHHIVADRSAHLNTSIYQRAVCSALESMPFSPLALEGM
jgi:hypothetical protein